MSNPMANPSIVAALNHMIESSEQEIISIEKARDSAMVGRHALARAEALESLAEAAARSADWIDSAGLALTHYNAEKDAPGVTISAELSIRQASADLRQSLRRVREAS